MYVTTYNAIFLKDFSSHGGSFFKYSVGFEKYPNKLAKKYKYSTWNEEIN